MDKIILLARAKLNLSLDITGLRDDGYHLMDMVMQSVSLSDCVTLSRADSLSAADFAYQEADTGYDRRQRRRKGIGAEDDPISGRDGGRQCGCSRSAGRAEPDVPNGAEQG